MELEFTIKNYRCFSRENPLMFTLRNGLTAFVGPNNAGKSTILKFFYEFRELFHTIGNYKNGPTLETNRTDVNLPRSAQGKDPQGMFSNLSNDFLEIEIKLIFQKKLLKNPNRQALDKVLVKYSKESTQGQLQFFLDGSPMGKGNFHKVEEGIYKISKDNFEVPLITEISNLQENLFIGSFRNALNLEGWTNYFDILIGKPLIITWDEHKNGTDKRKNDLAIRLTNDIKSIFNFDTLEINPSKDNDTFQVIINEKSYELEELGSGLAQFIIVLINVATKRPNFILIDEPESNLHPTLQLDFLTTLASYSKGGILFATHSLGLARSAAEYIYSIQNKQGSGSIIKPLEATPSYPEYLGELSFSGYQELGFDKILLVEGSKDIKTIQQLLRLYKKEHKIIILPLGGSSLINDKSEQELAEIKRISDNVHGVIDSEKTSAQTPLDETRKKFEEICKKLGIDLHILDKRAIENYFTDEAVKKIKGNKYRALSDYELLKNSEYPWAKSENWRIAREMKLEDIKSTDLGKFLESL